MAQEFLKEFWAQHRDVAGELPRFSDSTINVLRRASWPGNVRELRNVIEHMVVLADPGQTLEPSDIHFVDEQPAQAIGGATNYGASDVLTMEYHRARDQVMGSFEVEYLANVIRASGGNISDAARMAGVDRTTLYRLMDKHGIDRESLKKASEGR